RLPHRLCSYPHRLTRCVGPILSLRRGERLGLWGLARRLHRVAAGRAAHLPRVAPAEGGLHASTRRAPLSQWAVPRGEAAGRVVTAAIEDAAAPRVTLDDVAATAGLGARHADARQQLLGVRARGIVRARQEASEA